MPTLLAPLAEGFEEIEAVVPIDLLRRAGVTVTTAALGETTAVTGRSGITVHADTTLEAVRHQEFDAVFLPGGPGVKHLRADARLGPLLRRQAAAGRWIAAICAAPTVLHDAGLLHGRRYTAHFSVAGELPALQPHERVVVDGRLVTSRGAGTAQDFALELIARLVSPEKAAAVAEAICA
mgnify:CR=1 FL=1